MYQTDLRYKKLCEPLPLLAPGGHTHACTSKCTSVQKTLLYFEVLRAIQRLSLLPFVAWWNSCSGVFDAEVHPDLPPAWTTAGLLSHYLRRAREAVLDTNRHRTSSTSRSSSSSTGSSGAGTVGRAADCSSRSTRDKQAGSYLVRTVPVQVSRKKVWC